MNYKSYFNDIFESIPDYRKIVLVRFLKKDKDLILEVRFSERYINRLYLEFKNISGEELEDYYSFVKNEENSILENFLNK